MDIISLLIQDHRKVEQLFKDITANLSDKAQLDLLFSVLKREILAHDTVESQLLYPTMRQMAPKDHTLVEHAIHEHDLVKSTLGQMESIDFLSSVWAVKLRTLTANLLKHIKEEEEILFPRLRALMQGEALIEMGSIAIQIKQHVLPLMTGTFDAKKLQQEEIPPLHSWFGKLNHLTIARGPEVGAHA